MRPLPVATMLVLALGVPAGAQEAGWHYSPLPGEGDRAALGCAQGSDAQDFTCLAVRCEDDFSVGLHIHSSRPGGDAGKWNLDVDKESFEIATTGSAAPYSARVSGDVTTLIERLRHGVVAYLDPAAGPPVTRNGIPLAGSLHAIHQALYFCAPKVPDAAADQATR